jgi:steroid delta-isomerase-like uncharacterized protein
MDSDKKASIRRFYEDVLNNGDLAALDQLAVRDYEEHDPLPGQGEGLKGLKERVSMIRDAFGEQFTIEHLIAEGDEVAVRWIGTGTHVGEFMGIPPTNRSFEIAGIDIYTLRDGNMSAHWHVVDQLSLLQQLGLIPTPDGANA